MVPTRSDPNGVIPALASAYRPITRPRSASGVSSWSVVLQPVENRIWQQPRTTSKVAVVPKCPTNESAPVPALRTAAEAARNHSGGRPRRSRVKPMPAITAPEPSADMRSPNP